MRLRAPHDRFVGREAVLDQLESAIARGERLLTIWGVAGVGKTRVALELAARRETAGGPVLCCDLEAARDAEELCTAVQLALGPGRTPSRALDAVDRVGLALAERAPAIIVLDNLEQVVEYAAAVIPRWLELAADSCFVATSRERLRISGECAHELRPLELQPAENGGQGEAIALFVDRLRGVAPRYVDRDAALAPDDAALVARIVERLEGIPLAIELAAARADLLGLGGILERLDQQLALLAHGRRDAAGRLRTLRGAIDWSWVQLDEGEQEMLARCAVFRGPFSLEAAERVLDRPDALQLLQSLRDQSLLRIVHEGPDTWLSMFTTIRAYAHEKLAQIDPEAYGATVARHTAYYLDLARRANRGEVTVATFELDNLRAASERLLDDDGKKPDDTVALVLAVAHSLAAGGSPAGALPLLERADAAAAADAIEPQVRARYLQARAQARQLSGRLAESAADLVDGLGVVRALGRRELEGELLVDLGVLQHQLRDMQPARTTYEQALRISRELGDERGEGRILGNLGALFHDIEQFEQAARHYGEALAILERCGPRRAEGICRANLGILEQERGRLGRAEAHYREALATLAESGDRRLEAITLGNAGLLYQLRGDLEQAERAHRRAMELLDELGDRRSEALCLGRMAAVLAERGAIDEARSQLARARRAISPLGERVTRAVIELTEGFFDIREALERPSGARLDPLRRLGQRISRALAPAPDGGPSFSELSDDMRTTVRILERSLRERTGPAAAEMLLPDALVVTPGAGWFRPPERAWQDFRQRRPMRSILVALLSRHAQPGGGALTLEELREAGWPDERMVSEAGANRVYVALAGLRKAGLKPYLLRDEDGYRIDAALAVQWVATAPPEVSEA